MLCKIWDVIFIRKKGEYYPEYDDQNVIADSDNSRKVFINLGVADLKKEHERIKELEIAIDLIQIRYIEAFSLYGYLNLKILTAIQLK